MIVISDTSCISNLLTISYDHLLPSLFGEVVIPPAVAAELRVWHNELPSFLVVKSPTDSSKYTMLRSKLGAGEAEAICLAIELSADMLLMDGRRVAPQFQILQRASIPFAEGRRVTRNQCIHPGRKARPDFSHY